MEITMAILGSSVVATIISGIFQLLNNRKNKASKLEYGMCLLLLSSIRQDGKRLIDQGTVSREEYQIFCAEYDAYKALGGDGWADGVKAKVDALELDFND